MTPIKYQQLSERVGFVYLSKILFMENLCNTNQLNQENAWDICQYTFVNTNCLNQENAWDKCQYIFVLTIKNFN